MGNSSLGGFKVNGPAPLEHGTRRRAALKKFLVMFFQ